MKTTFLIATTTLWIHALSVDCFNMLVTQRTVPTRCNDSFSRKYILPRSTFWGNQGTRLAMEITEHQAHTIEYMARIKTLSSMMENLQVEIEVMKVVIEQLAELETKDPGVSGIFGADESFKMALAEAKAASDAFGPYSLEANEAWETLNAVAEEKSPNADNHFRYSGKALESHHNYNAVVDTQMLCDALVAMDKLQGFARFVKLEEDLFDMAEEINLMP